MIIDNPDLILDIRFINYSSRYKSSLPPLMDISLCISRPPPSHHGLIIHYQSTYTAKHLYSRGYLPIFAMIATDKLSFNLIEAHLHTPSLRDSLLPETRKHEQASVVDR